METIRQMTSMPAEHFRLNERRPQPPGALAGRHRRFDFEPACRNVSTLADPLQYVEGAVDECS